MVTFPPAIDWPGVVAALGRDVRALRTLVGYSQQGLALVAKTSQGTVSRLERGEGVDVPLVSAMKVAVALADGIDESNGAVAPRMRALVALADGLAHAPIPPPDPGLATLLRSYQALSAERRRGFLRVALPLVALVSDPGPC